VRKQGDAALSFFRWCVTSEENHQSTDG
jgi:hypothetical protein